MVDATALRGDEGTGDEVMHTCGCRDDDIVDTIDPGAVPPCIGSSPDESSDDQELRLDLNGSDTIELEVLALRGTSGYVRLRPPSILPSRVLGARNTSRTSRLAGSQTPEFCNIASFL
jgi:hypothetical protein